MAKTDVTARFWAKVAKADGCWLWTGLLTSSGYGSLWANGRTARAHRFSYELVNGPIPAGLTLDHLCRVRRCVNPDHLEAVTKKENTLRGECNAAVNARKTHCKRGHPLSGENLGLRNGGTWRYCRTCNRVDALRRNIGQHRKYEELEARICPEDVGFEEYITALRARLAKSEPKARAWDALYAKYSRTQFSFHPPTATREMDRLLAKEQSNG